MSDFHAFNAGEAITTEEKVIPAAQEIVYNTLVDIAEKTTPNVAISAAIGAVANFILAYAEDSKVATRIVYEGISLLIQIKELETNPPAGSC